MSSAQGSYHANILSAWYNIVATASTNGHLNSSLQSLKFQSIKVPKQNFQVDFVVLQLKDSCSPTDVVFAFSKCVGVVKGCFQRYLIIALSNNKIQPISQLHVMFVDRE